MESPIDLEILNRYLSGRCSARERYEVEQWLRRDPTRSLATIKDPAELYPPGLGDSEIAWARVRSGIHREPTPMFSRVVRPGQRYLAAALGTLVVCLMGVGLFVAQHRPETALREFSTGVGQRTTLQLPDGSTALLAPETRVRYPASFGKTSRTIEIEGQALFTVTHATGTPFIVRTPDAETRVLGTSFSVRRYAVDSAMHIVVAEGKVAVTSHVSTSPVIVTTGQEMYTTLRGTTGPSQVANLGVRLAWTQGKLAFVDVPLQEVLIDLKRMYAVDIRIESPVLASQVVTGVIEQTMTAEGAVRMLAMTLGGRVDRRGTTLYITE